MGFVNNTVSFVSYQVVENDIQGEALRNKILEGITVGRIGGIDVDLGNDQAAGFALFEDPLSTEFSEGAVFFDPLAVFSFRIDKLSVPPTTARLYVKRKVQERLESTRRSMMPREERQEITDSVKLDLLRRALPAINAVDVVWDMRTNRIRFYSTSPSVNEDFLVRFNQYIGLKLRAMNGVGVLESRLDQRELDQVWHLLPTSFRLGATLAPGGDDDVIPGAYVDDSDETSEETDNA